MPFKKNYETSIRFPLHEIEANFKKKEILTAVQNKSKREAKAEIQRKYMWVFMDGKHVRVKRLQTIDGMDVNDFIAHGYIKTNCGNIWTKKIVVCVK